MERSMRGAILPGDSTVKLIPFPIPKPGHGQVLVKTMASTICGSDIRCIYRAHTGKGPEGYQDGMVAGHEPCGVIVEEGPGLKRFKKGDRAMAIRCTREWGKMVLVGEGSDVTFNPSPDIMHGQKTIYGSWVTSLWRMEELVEHLVRWGIHPDKLITHRFTLDEADKAYALMASGKCGKVAVVFPDEDDEK